MNMIRSFILLFCTLLSLRLGEVNAFSVSPVQSQVLTSSLSFVSSSTALFGKKEARAAGNERKNKTERVKKQKDDVIEVEGTVLESLPNAMFRCSINGAPGAGACHH
jgi:hypothetical protein